MTDVLATARRQLLRQLSHWELASAELGALEQTASPQAWAALERYVGVALRANLAEAVAQLGREARVVRAMFLAARDLDDLDRVGRELVAFRQRYLRTETLVDFYGHAVNTRTNPSLQMTLRAFDVLAMKSMGLVLAPLGRTVPPLLTYLDKGLGASILKAGLRLWDGTISAVATVKVTYHNRRRPTALLHEAGHQIAHILDWNGELSEVFRSALRAHGATVAEAWAGWASEVAADCFAFVHGGFASVAALADVVGGETAGAFRFIPGDPHPISHLRVLAGVEMCRRFYGRGPWDELADAWEARYPVAAAPSAVRALLDGSRAALRDVVQACLLGRMRAFGNRALAELVDPVRVSPAALEQLEARALRGNPAPRWIFGECIRLVALTGWRFATRPEAALETARLQDAWMRRLGEEVESISAA